MVMAGWLVLLPCSTSHHHYNVSASGKAANNNLILCCFHSFNLHFGFSEKYEEEVDESQLNKEVGLSNVKS